MYDMKLLSTYNVTADGKRVDADEGQYSWLLVAGKMTDAAGTDALGVFVTNTNESPVITKPAE